MDRCRFWLSKDQGTRLNQYSRLHQSYILATLVLTAISICGCVSVQVASRDGKPKLIGFGSAKWVDGTEGQIYQIVAPGLSVRLHSYAPGLSLGWHETKFFYPSTLNQTGTESSPVAFQNRCAGINLAPTEIMFGVERSFAIPMPPAGSNMIQLISYSAQDPTTTIVERKETK